jgi:hypothetical protein
MRHLARLIVIPGIVLAVILGSATPAKADNCGQCLYLYYGSEWVWHCYYMSASNDKWCDAVSVFIT